MAQKADLVARVGVDLGLVRLNGSLQNQDNTRISSAYDEVYERLKEEGLAVWSSTGTVPTSIVPYVCLLMAQNCVMSGSYGVPIDRYQRIMSEAGPDGRRARANISAIVIPEQESTIEVKDY